MKQITSYKIIKNKAAAEAERQVQFGLRIKKNKKTVFVTEISTDKHYVKNMIQKLKPYNLCPEVAKEVITDLLY